MEIFRYLFKTAAEGLVYPLSIFDITCPEQPA